MERGSWKPNVEISASCPRCGSSNTKFCYYNNYSLTQPRYFCKGCRRYWTKGGSLRNVPVGGGCRKNRRSKSLRLSSTPSNAFHSKSYGYGGVMNNNHDYNKGIVAPSLEPSSSLVVPDGSHIDLAIVYANFLNPQQENSKNITDTSTGVEVLELPGEFDSSLETFPAEFQHHLSIDHHHHHHHHDNDHPFGLNHAEDHQLIYYCGLESSLTHQDLDVIPYDHQQCYDHNDHKRNPTGLPPLPGEETWPDSDNIAGLQKPPVFGDETDQDPNVLFGNWSPFYLSSTDDDTFSKSS